MGNVSLQPSLASRIGMWKERYTAEQNGSELDEDEDRQHEWEESVRPEMDEPPANAAPSSPMVAAGLGTTAEASSSPLPPKSQQTASAAEPAAPVAPRPPRTVVPQQRPQTLTSPRAKSSTPSPPGRYHLPGPPDTSKRTQLFPQRAEGQQQVQQGGASGGSGASQPGNKPPANPETKAAAADSEAPLAFGAAQKPKPARGGLSKGPKKPKPASSLSKKSKGGVSFSTTDMVLMLHDDDEGDGVFF